jgi:hypothetical protein
MVRIELRRAGEEDISTREIKRSRIAVMGIEAGKEPGLARGEIHLINVAERLLDKQHPLAVVGEISALSEERET